MNTYLLSVVVFLFAVAACSGNDNVGTSGGSAGAGGGEVDNGDAGDTTDADSGLGLCGVVCAIGSTCQPSGYCGYPCESVMACKFTDNRFNACIDGICAVTDGGS